MHQYEEQELLIKKGVTLINGRDLDTCSSKDLVRAIKQCDEGLKELKELNVSSTAITKMIGKKEQLLKDLVEILDAKEEETE